MGGAIARRMHASGHEVAVWNRDRGKAEELAVGPVFDFPENLAAASDIVLSSLTDPAALRGVYLGRYGAVRGASGQTFIDTSTAGPDVEIDISAALRQHRSELLDAPIAGVPAAVADGSALVLLSGDAPRAEAARRLLESRPRQTSRR